jgi:hypothetical protein
MMINAFNFTYSLLIEIVKIHPIPIQLFLNILKKIGFYALECFFYPKVFCDFQKWTKIMSNFEIS